MPFTALVSTELSPLSNSHAEQLSHADLIGEHNPSIYQLDNGNNSYVRASYMKYTSRCLLLSRFHRHTGLAILGIQICIYTRARQ